jgi:hypothetical protein
VIPRFDQLVVLAANECKIECGQAQCTVLAFQRALMLVILLLRFASVIAATAMLGAAFSELADDNQHEC